MNRQTIPVINIENLFTAETLRSVDRACREWGAFMVVGHGIEAAEMVAINDAMKQFFGLNAEAKRQVSRSHKNPWGFYDKELTKNIRDCKEIYDFGPNDDNGKQAQWPAEIPEFKSSVQTYYQTCERLAFNLLEAIGINLGVDTNFLSKNFRPNHSSFLRLNYYPLQYNSQQGMGVHQHTDAGAITVLLQDQQSGLEVFHQGCWHRVEPRDGALVINLGDIVQVWSNDRYQAPLHRVVASQNAVRYSAPFFLNPDYRTDFMPLPTTVDHLNPALYRHINWGEFRKLRADGDYTDSGEEVQICHYRI
ncbi:MAG: 2OG-Fe(II) oxygenase family protein [Pseudomonadales bacterium]